MTETIIALFSISMGILTSLLFGKLKPTYSFGISGDAILGVFGSILFLKTIGKLYAKYSILETDTTIFIVNITCSIVGALCLLGVANILFKKN